MPARDAQESLLVGSHSSILGDRLIEVQDRTSDGGPGGALGSIAIAGASNRSRVQFLVREPPLLLPIKLHEHRQFLVARRPGQAAAEQLSGTSIDWSRLAAEC